MAEQKKVVTKKTTAKAQGAEAGGKTGKATAAGPAAPAPAHTPHGVTRKTTAKKAAAAPVDRPVKEAPSSDSAVPPAPPATGKRGRKGVSPPASVEDHPPVLMVPGEVTPEQRWRMVADAAYFRAERRNFAPGYEQEDWLAAEAEVDALLQARAQPAEE